MLPNLPMELISIILSYRPTHPVGTILKNENILYQSKNTQLPFIKWYFKRWKQKGYRRNHYFKHIERIKDYYKNYYPENKEQIDTYNRQYYQANKTKIIKARTTYPSYIERKEVVICECGEHITSGNLNRHLKTKKHVENIPP